MDLKWNARLAASPPEMKQRPAIDFGHSPKGYAVLCRSMPNRTRQALVKRAAPPKQSAVIEPSWKSMVRDLKRKSNYWCSYNYRYMTWSGLVPLLRLSRAPGLGDR